MSDIGGYFAELKLLTDENSFQRGRKQLEDFTKAGERAVAVFSALQRISGGSGGGGDSRWVGGGGGNFSQRQLGYSGTVAPYSGGVVRTSDYIGGSSSGGGGGMRYVGNNFGQKGPPKPPGTVGGGGEEGSEDKSDKKKEMLTKLATLYMLKKAIDAMVKFTEAMWNLTGTVARATNSSIPSATLMGMTLGQYKRWEGAFNGAGLKDDFGGFSSGATDLENAYRNLKVGNPELYKKFAVPASMLGVNMNDMSSMGNNERMQALFNAAFKAKDQQRAIAALQMMGGDSWSRSYLWAKAKGLTTMGQFLETTGGNDVSSIATPSSSQVKAAAEFTKLQALLDALHTLLGNVALDEIKNTVTDLNTWIITNKETITLAFKAIAGIFRMLLDVAGGIGKAGIQAFAAYETYKEKGQAEVRQGIIDYKAGKKGLGLAEIFGYKPVYDWLGGQHEGVAGAAFDTTLGGIKAGTMKVNYTFLNKYSPEQRYEILEAVALERAVNSSSRRSLGSK